MFRWEKIISLIICLIIVLCQYPSEAFAEDNTSTMYFFSEDEFGDGTDGYSVDSEKIWISAKELKERLEQLGDPEELNMDFLTVIYLASYIQETYDFFNDWGNEFLLTIDMLVDAIKEAGFEFDLKKESYKNNYVAWDFNFSENICLRLVENSNEKFIESLEIILILKDETVMNKNTIKIPLM